jgi:hypothetical protein
MKTYQRVSDQKVSHQRDSQAKSSSPDKPSPKSSNSFAAFTLPKEISLKAKYAFLVVIFTLSIFVFSIFMASVASQRSRIADTNYQNTTQIYNGEINQSGGSLSAIDRNADSRILKKELSGLINQDEAVINQKIKQFVNHANIISTNIVANIDTEFVKKGLEYQPSFTTKFKAEYIIQNSLEEKSLVKFNFPFPFDVNSGEISNVRLLENGKEVPNPKINNQLSWAGTLPANGKTTITVEYETVGLSGISYEGLENLLGSQDFNMVVNINGTRSYDIRSGLSATEKEFGENSVSLKFEKPNLWGKPLVDVKIADKQAPSNKISRIYIIMAPIYLVFISILIWAFNKNKKPIKIKDLIITTVLFTLYFPFLHYLASFSIDPTMQSLSGFKTVGYFSLSLYGAFGIGLLLIGALLTYLYSRVYGAKLTLKSLLPLIIMFFGFFPLVITVPEFAILLVLVGVVLLTAFFIQNRVNELQYTE